MKFSNPSSSTLMTTATMFGGLVVGAMISKGVVGLIHKPSGATDEATLKKEKNALLLKRGAIVAGSAFAGASIVGNDTVSTVSKALAFGMASGQTIEIVKDATASNTKLADTSTTSKKFIANALGLACPCDAPAYGMGKPRRKSRAYGVRMPEMAMLDQNNIFDQAIQNAKLAS